MKLKLGENFFPLEPKMVDGKMQYGAEFKFTASDIVGCPLPKDNPLAKRILGLVEADALKAIQALPK